MNVEVSNLKWATIVAGLVLCGGALEGLAAQGGNSKPAAGATTTTTNAAPPKSIFMQPRNAAEGRDPFYPRSVYPYLGSEKIVEPTPVKTAPIVDVDLKLGGISGTHEHPLAIINGHTFEAGEEGEVPIGNGNKAHVRCLEIKPEGVLVFVNGQRRELRLRGGI